MTATYITTTIPYVNARPHIGHALELVQADVLARHHRGRGDAVRFQAGTDDNSLKNVLAAEAAGVGVREFVDRNAEAFEALGGALSLSVDDFIRTSRDPRHRPGVEAFWRACAGDLYRQRYAGLYCTGCEQFYTAADLHGGRCPEHGTEPEQVSEENWFFRLSRYAAPLREAITSGRLRIEPAGRRHEVLALIDGGLAAGHPAGRRLGRRGAGRLRLPPGHGGGLGDRGRGEPVHQPGPAVGPGRGRSRRAARCRAVPAHPGLHSGRPGAGAVPAGRGGTDHPAVHAPRRTAAGAVSGVPAASPLAS